MSAGPHTRVCAGMPIHAAMLVAERDERLFESATSVVYFPNIAALRNLRIVAIGHETQEHG
jgi:hypothetical protein